jgi:3-oxoacyl-(acyl-carrier-protein) synthase
MTEQLMASGVSARIGGLCGLGNQVTTNSSACSTGTEAVVTAAERIRAGLANRMLAGGAEVDSPYIWACFDSMRVLARAYNENPSRASRPMSGSAAGFVPGAGGAVLVLEALETALRRGARIYAEYAGGAITSGGMRGGGSMTAASAAGVQRCIRKAVTDAQIAGADIDYINGHLTATGADPQEIRNWSETLQRPPADFPWINSTKSMIGHCLAAAGAIECVGTVLQIYEQFVHPSINCDDLHPEIESFSNSIVRAPVRTSLRYAAKASFGFGDVNSCVVFKKWDSENV